MFEKLYLFSIILFFILAFALKNIKTALSPGLSIKGRSTKVNLSIVLSILIYTIIILRLFFLNNKDLLEFEFIGFSAIKYIGSGLATTGFVVGILALVAMKNSWRIGIRHEQKTDLVKNGIYRLSRNPYFFSYNILILGFILIFPSIILLFPYLILIITFHNMILEEEEYLEKTHGEEYLSYKAKVNRYITIS